MQIFIILTQVTNSSHNPQPHFLPRWPGDQPRRLRFSSIACQRWATGNATWLNANTAVRLSPGVPKGYIGTPQRQLPRGRISHQYVSDEDDEPIQVRPSKCPALSSKTRTSSTAPRWCDSMTTDDQNEADELLARAMHRSAASFTLFKGNHWKAWLAKIRPSYRFPEPDAIGGRLLNNEYMVVQKEAIWVIAHSKIFA
uniref:Uncharacterized protein n=1 Tax=Hyaloperonospora arabidopsidis (strain Emoy2) TaxID=559515 RepID=M4BB99_HYAAE